MQLKTIEDKISNKIKILDEEAVDLWNNCSDEELQHLSTMAKKAYHQDKAASYVIMSIINYTNICVAKCDYCAFYRLPHQEGTYLLTFKQICEKIDQLIEFGGTLVGFNGGFHPKLKIKDYAELFSKIRNRYQNQIEFYGMTVAEFMFSAKLSKLSYDEAAIILKENGSRWITGGGAEVLVDTFRMRHSPGKFKVADYYKAQEAILNAGLGSTATMVIGFDETLEERMQHLRLLRDFQDKQKNKLTSFLCWTYKPYSTELGGKEITTKEYLRWLAICRIYLHNIENMRTSVLTKNEQALIGLEYGCNDFDLPTEDEVTQKAGATISHDFDNILNFAKQRGFELTHRQPFQIQP